MTVTPPPEDAVPESPEVAAATGTLVARISLRQRSGGIVVPLLTAVIAFLIGGVVVAATGHNPLVAYRDIFNGAGLNWFFHPTTDTANTAAYNLSQTLLQTTTLILTGLAVAFAFRCGMFNIGGQGQYFVGLYVANWVGHAFAGMAALPHILLAVGAATLGGAIWAGIAGFLKATVGAHEVITTIMLNWVAYWVGSYLFGLGGPLQSSTQTSVPVSNDVVDSAKLPVFWGDPVLQGLHVGFFVALGALVVFWIVLNRTTVGYEVRAVGYNPEAARYGGIGVRKSYFLAMAVSGLFAGLAGAIDILGWEFHITVDDVQASTIGFIGIAVALLGRNTAVGTFFAALLFGALVSGTSTRHLDATVFRPELARNLTLLIQGLIVLFVGAPVLVVYARRGWRKLVEAIP